MKRPMMIGGMLGLVTALLALWIVWARSTPQDETLGGAGAPALGEQAAKPPPAPKPPTAGEGAANDAVAEGEPPKGAKGECNLGQHEIAFRFDEVVRTCDNHVIYKTAAKEIAAKHGQSLTFMAKSTPGTAHSSEKRHGWYSRFFKKTI